GFYLTLAEKADYHALAPGDSIPLWRVEAEQNNLRAALQWSVEQMEVETALRLSGALWYFWQIPGMLSEGRQWADTVFGLPGATEHKAAYAQALAGAGTLAWFQGDLATARSRCEESVAIRRELGDKLGLALSLNMLGESVLLQGDSAHAEALLREALALY